MSYESTMQSFSSVQTPTKRRAAKLSVLERNGKGLARLQKEKNGTLTKDELVLLDKEGMHPLVMHFFADELEKQAFTPAFAVRNSGAAGLKGAVARGYSRLFSSPGVLDATKNLTAAAQSPMTPLLGGEYVAATTKGMAKSEAAKRLIPMIKKNPQIADAATWWERNAPTHMYGARYSKLTEPIPDAVKTVFGI